MSTKDAPTQVRTRKDPTENLDHRYRQVRRAKAGLGKANITVFVVAACEHAVPVIEAKREAIELLGEDLPQQVGSMLPTPHVEISVHRHIDVGHHYLGY